MTLSRTGRRRLAAASIISCLLLSACGTRQSDSALVSAERGAGTAGTDGTPGSATAPDGSVSSTTGGATSTPGSAVGAGPQAAAVSGTTGASTTVGGTSGTSGSSGTSVAPRSGGAKAAASAIGPAGESTSCSKRLTPIRIGQVGTFSGFIAPVTGGSKPGLAAWVSYVNAHGGVACHPVQVFAEDDGADSSQAAAAVQDLVQNKHVVAVVGDFVPLSVQGFKSAVESAKVPAIGGDVLGEEWNSSPYMFPEMAGIYPVLYGSYKQLVRRGKTKAAILYCVETDICPHAYQHSTSGGDVKRAGATVVYSAQVSLTQSDYQAQCQNAKNAGADILGLYVDGSSMTRVMRSCAAINYYPEIATSAVALGATQSADPNVIKAGLSLSPGVFPWMKAYNPAQQTYQQAMKQYAPNTASDGATSGAWASGALFAAAINKLGAAASKDITIADVMRGLGLIKNETIQGLAPPITFTAGESSAPTGRCYYDIYLKPDGGWDVPLGPKYECMP